jgi:hypothetical protein
LDAYRRRLEHGPPAPRPLVFEDTDLESRVTRFREETGAEPEEWLEAWEADRFDAESARTYIRALGILTAEGQQAAPPVSAVTASAR